MLDRSDNSHNVAIHVAAGEPPAVPVKSSSGQAKVTTKGTPNDDLTNSFQTEPQRSRGKVKQWCVIFFASGTDVRKTLVCRSSMLSSQQRSQHRQTESSTVLPA